MNQPASQLDGPSYPLIKDIYDIVPLSFTKIVPVRPHQKVDPNSLQMIRCVHGTTPSFPEHIHQFSIPGCTELDAEAFFTAMQATVYWSSQQSQKKKDPVPTPSSCKIAEEIQKNWSPQMVKKWLTERVISGLNWKYIHQLMHSLEII
ncbi:uncharacterized protein PGTG_06160 [Puccinia graminis f. sp. tritici CRL 75-36-700-3]|uniref:Uncharacterized protein n=1 Tax=Puccinia graminis f. sp. tritici (strain CRL 75-36-700-3 / race SCCL) TaxID=418459 RepID=E3K7X7_PUCGT|nr:uncharacterized protein PGTG_06160 [Puccinia graminis f. sp. tritici CRL 75-36-700-3]EFP80204.1 hypothetical protein PGTG_06160 [Puccinia graminis f. sp. tritici CRL 75-36-700-3]